MQSFIRDKQDLEVNPIFNRKPVQLKKDGRNVVKASDITYESGSCVLDSLKFIQLGGW